MTRTIHKFSNLLANPIKSLPYLRLYLLLTRQIQAKNRSLLIKLYFLNFTVFLQILHMLYLYLCPPDTPLRHALHFDVFYALIPKPLINLFVSLVAVLVLYLNYAMFLAPDAKLNALLSSVLLEKNSKFFLKPKFKGKSAVELVIRSFIVILNIFLTFIALTDIFVVYFTLIYTNIFVQNWSAFIRSQSSVQCFLYLFFHLLRASIVWISFYNFSHIISLSFSTALTLLLMFYIKMKQTFALLDKLIVKWSKASKRRRFHTLHYTVFRRHFYTTLGFFLQINAFYGKLFLASLLAQCRVNVCLNIWLISGVVEERTFVLCLSGHETLFIFGLHLLLAKCTKHIHQTAPLFTLAAESRERGLLCSRTRVRLNRDIATLHTANQLGATYGAFGLISLNAFTKYLLLYGKFMMKGQDMISKS